MRILVINYEMDRLSPVLAWQIHFVEALSERVDQVVVLTEVIGELNLPDTIVVERLALEEPGRFGRYRKLHAQVRRLCRTYAIEVVFVHMAHRWAYRFFPLFKVLRLPVLMWYTHGAVNWHLRLALWSVQRVVTATPEGFRIPSNKVHSIGHGIDTRLFQIVPRSEAQTDMITVSRISARKRIDLLVDVVAWLRDQGRPLKLVIVGAPLTDEDRHYEAELMERVEALDLAGLVTLAGFVPMASMSERYQAAFLNLNVSQTNSMDKAVLEALACGCPVLTSNPAFYELFQAFPELIIRDESPAAIGEQVLHIFARRADYSAKQFRALVIGHHDLETYAGRVIEHLAAIS